MEFQSFFLLSLMVCLSVCIDQDFPSFESIFDDENDLLYTLSSAFKPPTEVFNAPVISRKEVYDLVRKNDVGKYYRQHVQPVDPTKEMCNKKMVTGGWGYYPYPGSCNQYIHCSKDQGAFLKKCATGTFFDKHICARVEDVDCPFDPCKLFPSGYMYPDGETCYGYYICVKGRSKSGTCPNTFAFSNTKDGCVPDTACLQLSSLRHPCFPGTTKPIPEEPTMFYLWNGAKSLTPMTCPKGLWYNPIICSCDWIIPGKNLYSVCQPMFSFSYDKSFIEDSNKVPQDPNTQVSIYQRSARFTKGGRIVIWMMNDLDMDSEWAMCFEFMTHAYIGEVALVSNDWAGKGFTYKITYIPEKAHVTCYFRMKDDSIADLTIVGVDPSLPHFLRVAKIGPKLKVRVDNTAPAEVLTKSGVAPTKSPMVIGVANNCEGFEGFFDELKFFRCVPDDFFDDYKRKIYNF